MGLVNTRVAINKIDLTKGLHNTVIRAHDYTISILILSDLQ